LTHFSNNTQIQNFTKICPMGTKLFHVDRADGHRQWRNLFGWFLQFCKHT